MPNPVEGSVRTLPGVAAGGLLGRPPGGGGGGGGGPGHWMSTRTGRNCGRTTYPQTYPAALGVEEVEGVAAWSCVQTLKTGSGAGA